MLVTGAFDWCQNQRPPWMTLKVYFLRPVSKQTRLLAYVVTYLQFHVRTHLLICFLPRDAL